MKLCMNAQLCPNLWDPMDCSPPGSCVHGVFLAEVSCHFHLQGIFLTRGWTQVSCIGRRILLPLSHGESPTMKPRAAIFLSPIQLQILCWDWQRKKKNPHKLPISGIEQRVLIQPLGHQKDNKRTLQTTLHTSVWQLKWKWPITWKRNYLNSSNMK